MTIEEYDAWHDKQMDEIAAEIRWCDTRMQIYTLVSVVVVLLAIVAAVCAYIYPGSGVKAFGPTMACLVALFALWTDHGRHITKMSTKLEIVTKTSNLMYLMFLASAKEDQNDES